MKLHDGKEPTCWPIVMVLIALALISGCTDNEEGDTSPDTRMDVAEDHQEMSGGPLEIQALAAIRNPANTLSFFIEFRTNEPATSTLSISCGDDYSLELTIDETETEHAYFVMGLYDGLECVAEVVASTEASTSNESVSFKAGPLPDFLPEMEVEVLKEDEIQQGWTLTNLNNSFDNPPFTLAAFDEHGRYRWYHQLPVSSPGSDNDVRTVPEGILIGGTRNQVDPTILSWHGTVVWTRPLDMHHDIRLLEDGKTLRRIWDSRENCPTEYRSGVIIEYDMETEEEIWSWHLCEHFEPDRWWGDWSHTNTIAPVLDENAILLSLRNQNSIFKVNRDSGEIEWTMGPEVSDFTFLDDGEFWQQHAPEHQPSGNIVLYDNGLSGVRESSRMIEIAYDEETMEAEIVWSYEPDPVIFTPIWGDADRLPNGNTLGTFGQRDRTEHSFLIEVNGESEVVWRLKYPLKWGSYRAERIVEPVLGYSLDR